jgi:glycosyltransferase involved in cell wall biosynthesis
MIDILIPTFNRCESLKKNLLLLNQLAQNEEIGNHFAIQISDNCSTDDTLTMLAEITKEISLPITVHQQTTNLGGTMNVAFLLAKTNSDFFMFLGDDDFLPAGFLSYIAHQTAVDKQLSAIVPGFSSLYPDGKIIPQRFADFSVKKYPKGISTTKQISGLGHQLSGIVFRSTGIAEQYLAKPELINIYPTVGFLAMATLKGVTHYTPCFQVLVSQGNNKDWRYDESGLVTEIFRNYQIIFPEDSLKRTILSLNFILQQEWRLRISRNPFRAIPAIFHILKTQDVDVLVKITLPLLYPWLYIRHVMRFYGL